MSKEPLDSSNTTDLTVTPQPRVEGGILRQSEACVSSVEKR